LFGLPDNFGRQNEEGVAMVETVRKNFEGFTAKEVKDAAYARKAHGMVGSPSDDEFASMVSTMKNCPVKRSDIANATAIFDPNRNLLRGKTVRQRLERVEVDFIQILCDYYVLHKFVTLTADLMFVSGIPFLVTLSRGIRLYTAEYMPTRTVDQLGSSLKKVLSLYQRGGFIVRVILMDMEFESLSDELELVQVNTTTTREHVGDIEHAIQTMKDR
jgi:hypothetical protein